MSELFGREAVLTAGSLQVSGLRMSFKIEKTPSKDPNTAEIKIWNLAASTRAKLQEKAIPIVFEAGYRGATQVLFSGDIRKTGVWSTKSGTDWVTTLRAGDGEQLYRTMRINESMAPGATLKDAIVKTLGTFGDSAKEAISKIRKGDFEGAMDQFSGGVVLSGSSQEELSKLLAPAGLTLSFQDGKLQVLKAGEANTESAIVLAPNTGLIGSPEPGAKGFIKCKSLLQPGIRPGRKLQIKTAQLDGFFVCGKVNHNGDTHGANWFSDIEAVSL